MGTFAVLGCESEKDTKPETIKIGAVLPFIPAPTLAEHMSNAAQLAIDEINAAGGVLGKNLELVKVNYDTVAAVPEAITQLLDANQVVGIVGPTGSGSVVNAATVSVPRETLLISPVATSSSVTALQDNDLVWRTPLRDDWQGKVAAEFAYYTLGKRSANIIHSLSPYGQSIGTFFKTAFEELGGKVNTVVTYPNTDYATYDFTTDVRDVFANSPEFVFLGSDGNDGTKILNTAGTEGFFNATPRPQVMGPDGMAGSKTLPPFVPSDVAEGFVATSPWAEHSGFAATYLKRYQTEPHAFAGHMYDAIYLIAYATLEAQTVVSKDVAPHLRTVSAGGTVVGVNEFARGKALIEGGGDIDYDGASGKIAFDAAGDVTSGNYRVLRVVKGGWRHITSAEF
jgi:branched-chain amino acid transport system substrate-binding protein